jgi:putative component of toxin-antitoxin plasmid stabilization module
MRVEKTDAYREWIDTLKDRAPANQRVHADAKITRNVVQRRALRCPGAAGDREVS